MSTNRTKSNKILIVLLCLLTAIAIGVTIFTLIRHPKQPNNSDYAPQQVEPQAEEILDEKNQEKLEQSNGGGAVSLTYSTQVTLHLEGKNADLLFQNPIRSNQNMMLELVLDGKTIAKTGTLEPGYKIEHLSDVDMQKLSEGSYEGEFRVSYYHTDSGEKAIVNTVIPVQITVQK